MTKKDMSCLEQCPAINYSFQPTRFGEVMIASCELGICALDFADNHEYVMSRLRKRYPKSELIKSAARIHKTALQYIEAGMHTNVPMFLCVEGTDFQLSVWNALLDTAVGETTTYGAIAKRIGKPKAVRAVGTAVGNNPISLLIPCHRVIRSDGAVGEYHWGHERKAQILQFEKELAGK